MQLIGCISTRSPTDSFRGGHEAYENRGQRSSRNRECGARRWERELLTIASQKARVGTALATTVGLAAAGALVIAAGVYELTRLKQHCRRCCRESAGSGFAFGLYCVGSSIGLMVMLVALGVMSITWMLVIAVMVLVQKVLPAKPAIDVPVALAITVLGMLIVVAPALVPGLMPPM